jgi:hypothetical protein
MPSGSSTNSYHKTGTWSGLTYTATNVDTTEDLAFTIPTGTSATTVALGNHSHTITANATDGIWDITGTNGTNAVTYAVGAYSAQQSKLSFDTSTTTPSRTDRLNLNGYLYATKLYSGGKEVLTDHQPHQSIKTLDTTQTTSQSTSSNEAIAGSGTIKLHKVSKTGDYEDLLNKPTFTDSWRNIYVDGAQKLDGTPGEANTYLNFAKGSYTTLTWTAGSGSTPSKLTIEANATALATTHAGAVATTYLTASNGVMSVNASTAGNRANNTIVATNAAGTIQTEKLAVSVGTTTKATMQYNSTDDCIEFVWVA